MGKSVWEEINDLQKPKTTSEEMVLESPNLAQNYVKSNPKSKNKKSAKMTDSSGVSNVMRNSGLSSYFEYSSLENLVKSFSANYYKTVEVGGIAPPDPWMISRSPHYITPTVDIFYHNNLQNAKWIKVAYLTEGDQIAVADENLKRVKFVRIKKIKILPSEQVYDIEVEGTHNFIGNDIVAHNTYITGGLGVGQVETTAGNITGTGRLAITSTSATSTFSTGGLTVGTSQFVVQQTSGNVGIRTTTVSGLLTVGTTTPAFVITSAGKVGIGTTSPWACWRFKLQRELV